MQRLNSILLHPVRRMPDDLSQYIYLRALLQAALRVVHIPVVRCCSKPTVFYYRIELSGPLRLSSEVGYRILIS